MSNTELQMLFKVGDDLFASLERETLFCLKNLESMPVKEIEHFVKKRHEILAAIQKFDMAFNHDLDHSEWSGEEDALEKFRQRLTALLRRVLEADGLLLAIAERELTSLKAQLAGISSGRRALHGYREEGGNSQSSLKRIA